MERLAPTIAVVAGRGMRGCLLMAGLDTIGTWDSQPYEVHAGECLTRVTLDLMGTLAGVDRRVPLFREKLPNFCHFELV